MFCHYDFDAHDAEKLASCINTNMKNSNHLKNRKFRVLNIQIDSNLYYQLRSLKLVSSTDALSQLCGKTTSYYRSMKAKHIGLKIGSLATLREQLSLRMEQEDDPHQSILYGYGMKAVEHAIRSKVLLQGVDNGKVTMKASRH
jgi:hypothetical protein